MEIYYNQKVYSIDDEMGRDKISKSFMKVIDHSWNDKNISELYNSLFILLLIKNDENCIKYRKYLYMVFDNFLSFIEDKKLNNLIDYNCYKKLQMDCLKEDRFEDLDYNPILELINNNKLSKEIIKEKNNIFFEELIDYIKKDYDILSKYWKIVFKNNEELNKYLLENNVKLSDLVRFEKNILLPEVVYQSCQQMIMKTPSYYGFNFADRFIDYFRKIYEILNEKDLEEIINLMNKNDQFYNCNMINYFLKLLFDYVTSSTSIDVYKYRNLFNSYIKKDED